MAKQSSSLVRRVARALARSALGREVAAELSAPTETDATFFAGGASSYYTDRYTYERDKVLAECLRAWRVNPVARNIVRVISAFVVGKGITLSTDHAPTAAYLAEWWDHPLNKIGRQLKDWNDEVVRSGNMFFLFSVDRVTGMTYVRAVPADAIGEIKTRDNDVMQETAYLPADDPLGEPWPAFDPLAEQDRFMVHFAFNRPVGSSWGEPDLAPMLPWIGRLSTMLEDRVRLNHFRSLFLYVVQLMQGTPEDAKRRAAELNANPPKPGEILVTTPAEQWGILPTSVDAFDANQDILAIKKFVAAGVTFPLHWLAEPESSTRTTAEAAGTPTFRTLEQSQLAFVNMLEDLARIALTVRSRFDGKVNPRAEIEVKKPDITERDNGALALAANRVWPVVMDLFDRKMIDAKEAVSLIYRMIAEPFEPVENLLKAVRVDPRRKTGAAPGPEPTPPNDPNAPQQEESQP